MSAECIVLSALSVWYTKYYDWIGDASDREYATASKMGTHLAVVICQLLRANNAMQICLHELLNDYKKNM